MNNLRVNFTWPVLSGGGMRQAQQVHIRAIVSLISDLAPGQERLERQGAGECQDLIGVRSDFEAMVHHLGDKTGNAEQIFRNCTRICGLFHRRH